MPKPLDLVGQKYGRLRVVAKLPARNQQGKVLWQCTCSCGNTVNVSTKALRTSNTRSCGCLWKERITTHGASRTRTYRIWGGVKTRCYNPNAAEYPLYGGRGIDMPPQWRDSFEAFLSDMGECPAGMTLERIDNNTGYSKENCRWASRKEQAENRSSTRLISFDGVTQTMSAWAEYLDIRPDTLWRRFKSGWSVEKALTTPARKYNYD